MISETDSINQFLDEQLLDLEQKFNQFMKEIEDDLIFPSFLNNGLDSAWDDDSLVLDDRHHPSKAKKHLITFDKHTAMLFVTGTITVTVFVYLGLLLSGHKL